MPVTVTTAATTRNLTTEARVILHLGGTSDALLTLLVRAASRSIVSYCQREFAREAVTEMFPAYGGPFVQLSRTPIVSVTAVRQEGTALTDWAVHDRTEGTLYRRAGWGWTAQRDLGLGGRQRWPGYGFPMPSTEEPQFDADYVGGYLLPGQSRTATVSVQASDQSFNDSGNGFPLLLRAGDVVEAVGWSSAPNLGRFVVSGTPTSGKIQVSGAALVDEVAGASKGLELSNLPEDVEKACIEAVRAWKLQAQKDPSVIERQLGPARERLSESDLSQNLPLPGVCIGLLGAWRRAA
jgi:hypothetical protein